MLGSVWGKTFQIACEKLDEINRDYIRLGYDINQIIHTKFEYCIEYKNGDIWRALTPTESRRGYKSNIAYIDSSIPLEKIITIIKPTLICLPYTGYYYY